MIAYQADQRRHLQAVIVPLVNERIARQRSKLLRPPTNTREASGVSRKVLDKAFLLRHCYGREPSDLCVCNVSSAELQDVSNTQVLIIVELHVHVDKISFLVYML